ncbi:MAG: sulfotransferase family 2 domain-containing protein [Halothiobacillaceae bacterium]|nr:sulfotransferase family 2 domain-containing protein [Halothiobacillaceae bacterium]
MPLTNTFFFVHLPKTAGTSFRVSAAAYFGQDACFFDYGAEASDTSEIIQKNVYSQQDLFSLERRLHRLKARFFAGHVNARRYAPLFQARCLTTFIRNPREQFVSHFQHKVRHHGYQGSLLEMLSSAAGPDLQSRMLSGIPLDAYGFVGVTERYQESLRVFNTLYQVDLPYLQANQNPDRSGETYDLPKEIQDGFNQKAKIDLALHARANLLLDQRLLAIDEGYSFVHGSVTTSTALRVEGYAFNEDSDKPVRVQLWVGEKRMQTTLATLDRPLLRSINAPRNGHVGFEFNLKNIREADSVRVCVADTGQLLSRSVHL